MLESLLDQLARQRGIGDAYHNYRGDLMWVSRSTKKAILDAMGEALVKGHRIEIRGFGSFSVNRRSPRIGRNPRSGESVMIPEKRVPHFKPGKALREQVDAKTAEILARETKKPD